MSSNPKVKPPQCFPLDQHLETNWKRFKSRLEHYSVAIKLAEQDKAVHVAIILNLFRDEVYDLVLTLKPTGLDDAAAVIKVLDDYIKPKRNLIRARFMFNSRNQQELEPFESFFLDIQKLAKKCEFGDLKSSLIRDRLVISITDQKLRERLLGEEKSLDEVVQICRAVEAGRSRADADADCRC